MVDVSEVLESKFLNREYIQVNNISEVVVQSEGTWNDYNGRYGLQHRLLIEVSCNNSKRKVLALGKSNIQRISQKYGSNSNAWVNKKLKVSIEKILIRGTLQDTLVVSPF